MLSPRRLLFCLLAIVFAPLNSPAGDVIDPARAKLILMAHSCGTTSALFDVEGKGWADKARFDRFLPTKAEGMGAKGSMEPQPAFGRALCVS